MASSIWMSWNISKPTGRTRGAAGHLKPDGVLAISGSGTSVAVHALRYGYWPLSPLYKEFSAFDRAARFTRTKCIYLDSVGLRRRWEINCFCARPSRANSASFLGPLHGADIQVRGPCLGLCIGQINSRNLAQRSLKRRRVTVSASTLFELAEKTLVFAYFKNFGPLINERG